MRNWWRLLVTLGQPQLSQAPVVRRAVEDSSTTVPDLEWWQERFQGPVDFVQFLNVALPLFEKSFQAQGAAAIMFSRHQEERIHTLLPLGIRFHRALLEISSYALQQSSDVLLLEGAESPFLMGDLSLFGFKQSLLVVMRSKDVSGATTVVWLGYKRCLLFSDRKLELARRVAEDLLLRFRMLSDLQSLSLRAEKAESSSREKGELLAHFSHDIRSPLNNIRAALTVLRLDTDRSEQLEMLNAALTNCDSLSEIVDELLDYTCYRAGKLGRRAERFDLGQLLREVVESFKLSARFKGLDFCADGLMRQAVISADRRQVRRIMSNLLSNAIKYTKTGGVTVKLESEGGSRWRIRVADSGIGLSALEQSKLFTPFTRFATEGEGIGLGLAVTKILVDLNEGEISVDSRKGKGSTFVVSFESAEPIVAQDVSIAKAALLHVLLVDDDVDFLQSLGQVLTRQGFAVSRATGISEAFHVINYDRPDVVVADGSMPGGGGKELAQAIERTGHKIRFCLLSGRRIESELDNYFDAAFQKPVEISELVRWLRQDQGEQMLSRALVA